MDSVKYIGDPIWRDDTFGGTQILFNSETQNSWLRGNSVNMNNVILALQKHFQPDICEVDLKNFHKLKRLGKRQTSLLDANSDFVDFLLKFVLNSFYLHWTITDQEYDCSVAF